MREAQFLGQELLIALFAKLTDHPERFNGSCHFGSNLSRRRLPQTQSPFAFRTPNHLGTRLA
jgi:hypothetical protein